MIRSLSDHYAPTACEELQKPKFVLKEQSQTPDISVGSFTKYISRGGAHVFCSNSAIDALSKKIPRECPPGYHPGPAGGCEKDKKDECKCPCCCPTPEPWPRPKWPDPFSPPSPLPKPESDDRD